MKSDNTNFLSEVFTIREQALPRPVIIGEEHSGSGYMDDVAVDYDSDQASQMVIEKAAEHAKLTIAKAIEQAQAQREDILAQAVKEAQAIKQQAYEEGVQTGMQSKTGEINDCIKKIELAISVMEGEQAGFIAEHEENLRWLALEIAARVLNKRIDDDKEMESLVKAAIKSVKNAEWIRVEIAESMTGLIDSLTQLVKQNEGGKVQVIGVTEPVGTCIIDTPQGRIDASVYTQLANLKEYFTHG